MRLKFYKTIVESQEKDNPVADVCWSPNNVKLAVATSDRVVLIFDRDGDRRDKFSTKPADPAAGKKSYVITAIAFSDSSELLGVAQSDNMVFVYRVGADWSGKKVICNKFPLTGTPMKLLPADNGFYTGTSDGKIRLLDCKNNKSTSLWTAGACCVSMSRGAEGAIASGHVDGTLYLGGRMLLRYALPPTVLVLMTPYLIVGACDGRISIYEAQRGVLVRTVEPTLAADRKDLIAAEPSSSRQTIAFGIFDGCLIGEVSESGNVELSTVPIRNSYATRSLAWSPDGTKLALASQTGAVILLEAVLRRWVWRDSVEVQHLSPKEILLIRQAKDAPSLSVTTKKASDIFNVRFIGNDWYAVCRTSNSLILCDLARGLTSEIPWTGSGERVYAAVGGACLIHRAGELSVVEYGLDKVLHTVRTERVNPHVLSVRINERSSKSSDEKHLAYLLDRQTVAVVDLVTGSPLGQWWHEARIDWLELNEDGRLLLLRDTRRRLALLNLQTGDKEIIASGVSFVQWIENSDAVIAQTPTHLLIWYSAWEANNVEMMECGVGSVTEVTSNKVLLEGGQQLMLDHHRLAFNNALRNGDLKGCAQYLDEVGTNADVISLWRQLAEQALLNSDLQLATKCYREVGDEASFYYLEETVKLAIDAGHGDVKEGQNNPLIQARLAIYNGDLSHAEEFYVRKAKQPDLAIAMYKQFNKWTEAIALAETTDRSKVEPLKQQYMDYLKSTGRVGEAGAVLAASGDYTGAMAVWLAGGRARRCASLLTQHSRLLADTGLVRTVRDQLLQEEWWEMAGEISEKLGDTREAVDYYAKGNNYARAVQLAKESCPSEVIRLEAAWGQELASTGQAGAAVPHLIEAGDTRAALGAALAARQATTAAHIVQVIDDKESIKEECEKLADLFISSQDWEAAERLLVSCNMTERCVRAYNSANKLTEGLRLANQHMSEEEMKEIYLPLARQMRDEGQLKKAEQIYIGLGEPDDAISMYKEASQYEAMLRLVNVHRSSLLEATRRHVAQALQASGNLHQAENYYIQAGDWKSAMTMYRNANQLEQADRVARAHGNPAAQQQAAWQWAASLPAAAAARLLATRSLASQGQKWALQAQRWDIALELSSLGGPVSKSEIAKHEASALAEDNPEEAEAAFLRAGAAEPAVRMWLQKGHRARALQLAESHVPHMVEEVLVEGAQAAAERGDLAQFEALMIRANRPRDVVQHYKELEMWDDAARVSREYLPEGGEVVPSAVPPLLQRAASHADSGEWWEAVRLLCAASAAGAEGGATRLAERAALRAARLARDKLSAQQRRQAAQLLHERFVAIGQSDVGDQLRAALSDGFEAEDEPQDAPADYVDVETSVQAYSSDADNSNSLEAVLDSLARGGQWARCLAKAAATPHRQHYALAYAAYLLQTHKRVEGVDIDSDEPPEPLSHILESLVEHIGKSGEGHFDSKDQQTARAIASELLVRVSTAPKAKQALLDAAGVMTTLGASDKELQAITLMLALHVPVLASRAARSLPRYTDIIVADAAYHACGMVVRNEPNGGGGEAFVLLNKSLDLAEAADDDTLHTLDFSDLDGTDWSRSPLVLERATVRGASMEEAREWLLARCMDSSHQQTLPLDSRDMFAASVSQEEPVCVVTGYPLGSRLLTFTNGRCANREWWSRFSMASKNGGIASDLLNHIQRWCGNPDLTHI